MCFSSCLLINGILPTLQEYNDANALVIADDQDPEEAARNAQILSKIEASIAAATAAVQTSRGSRGGRPRKSGRGKTPSAIMTKYVAPMEAVGATKSKRGRSVSFADEDEFESYEEEAEPQSTRLSRRQAAKNLQRILENQGQWENIRGGVDPPSIPTAMPSEAWEALGHAGEDAATLACDAADLASSFQYFMDDGMNEGGSIAAEVGAVTRLAILFAAAVGVVNMQDSLTKADRERLGLEGQIELPPIVKADPKDLPPNNPQGECGFKEEG